MILARQKQRIKRRMRIARNDEPKQHPAQNGILYERGLITKMVVAEDSKPEPVRSMRGYTHVSSLVNFCPRQHAICLQEDHIVRHPVAGDRITWRFGRTAEDHVREQIVSFKKRDAIIGKWSCVCGHTEYEGIFDPEHAQCVRCKKQPLKYGELILLDHEHKVRGSPDIVLIEQDGLLVVEIKNTTKQRFENMNRPLADHVFQAAAYREILKNNGYGVTDNVIIFVVSKDWAFTPNRIYKEFSVRVKDERIEQQVQEAFGRNVVAREAIARGSMPLRICGSMGDPLARQCPAVVSCFQRA